MRYLPPWLARPGAARRSASPPPTLVIGSLIVLLLLAFPLLGPLLWRVDPLEQSLIDSLAGSSWQHPLGADQQGRDILARLIAGGRLSLVIGIASMLVGLVVGCAFGIAAALSKGALRSAFLRLVDALLAIPGIVQAVIFVTILGQSLTALIIALGCYSIPIFARSSYNAVRQIQTQVYFEAAAAIGVRIGRLTWRYILPNILPLIVTIGTLRIGANILTGAALNFLGLGVQPPTAEWGLMIADAKEFSYMKPELLFYPGALLFLTGLGFGLLGDGVRDWIDAKRSG
ncbi:ABC transporter permease [Bosea sp. (in: a-proteobacteria)]|uniref:ABC transporter permease n=1 Tax=Bosea sp. (in: a-proteobacteria) TaxID=1871050 RepID=UPI0026353EF2|nr:ABC transporter permease [Bosea sp. (in: a-proteobacteria)]MCO5091655.1 ABC transporter permease [Bosea sp. (in: a-proteobacteria)]